MLRRVQDEGRALVLVANKTDLLSPQERANFAKNLNRVLEWKAPNLVGTVGEAKVWGLGLAHSIGGVQAVPEPGSCLHKTERRPAGGAALFTAPQTLTRAPRPRTRSGQHERDDGVWPE